MRGRCRATRLCDYCGRLAAIEAAEMVALDACSHAPTLYGVLTTRDPRTSREAVRRHLDHATRAIRRRWPAFQAATFVEFTTGLSPWSRGQRRIHLNLLVKGVPVEQADELEGVLRGSWGRRTATTQLVVVPIYAAEGLVKYVTNLALHVAKEGQRPPRSWRGHRVRWTRGYFARSAEVTRAEARASLQRKRAEYRLRQAGVDVDQAVALAELELEAQAAVRWELVEVRRLADSQVVEPVGAIERTRLRGLSVVCKRGEVVERESGVIL